MRIIQANILFDKMIKNSKNAKETREEGVDKFYTVPSCSNRCIDKVFELYDANRETSSWDFIIEPSAGNGSFLNQIRSEAPIIGIDILPEHPSIVNQDFFTYSPPQQYTNILVIGNPPFGKNSSLAVQFFNHSAQWAQVIAFIVPRTFRKNSVANKLNPSFHLIYDEEIPVNPCQFSPEMMVKCCFQIWERRDIRRNPVYLPITHPDWEFVKMGPLDSEGQPTPPVNADFAMRAYGGKIGEIKTDELDTLRPKSWHWFRCNSSVPKAELIGRLKKLDYSASLNTARQNSMGKSELVELYRETYG